MQLIIPRNNKFKVRQRFTSSYLKVKFDIGQGTGKKLDPDVVATGMRRAQRLFAQQISSFSRLAAKSCQQEAQVTEQDVLAVEEQVNFSTARDTVLSSPHITHPIVVDQYLTICVP